MLQVWECHVLGIGLQMENSSGHVSSAWYFCECDHIHDVSPLGSVLSAFPKGWNADKLPNTTVMSGAVISLLTLPTMASVCAQVGETPSACARSNQISCYSAEQLVLWQGLIFITLYLLYFSRAFKCTRVPHAFATEMSPYSLLNVRENESPSKSEVWGKETETWPQWPNFNSFFSHCPCADCDSISWV